MKTAFYLRNFTFFMIFMAVLSAGCTKDDSSTTPEYGYVQLSTGSEIKFSIANESTNSPYILTNQGPLSDETVSLTVQMPDKPTGTVALGLNDNIYVTYAKLKDGVTLSKAYFGMSGDSLKTAMVGEKLVMTMSSLAEVDIDHKPVAGSTLRLSGKLTGR